VGYNFKTLQARDFSPPCFGVSPLKYLASGALLGHFFNSALGFKALIVLILFSLQPIAKDLYFYCFGFSYFPALSPSGRALIFPRSVCHIRLSAFLWTATTAGIAAVVLLSAGTVRNLER